MAQSSKEKHIMGLLVVALAGWFVPGGGYFLLNEKKRAIIIFTVIAPLFFVGLYVGSIGVIDPIGAWPWYIAQIMNSPLVFALGHHTAGGAYYVYGRPSDVGQIYTSIAGLLNLLCIVNSVHLAHQRRTERSGD